MTTLRENTKQQGMLANSNGRRKKIKTSIAADAGMNTKIETTAKDDIKTQQQRRAPKNNAEGQHQKSTPKTITKDRHHTIKGQLQGRHQGATIREMKTSGA
ncbi:hypothetical protein BKA57DRAFT_433787 [Linnemannia elongata]|nr:hypothetical protein BKA57DRAFT_433787 [Linnemannia elongata]